MVQQTVTIVESLGGGGDYNRAPYVSRCCSIEQFYHSLKPIAIRIQALILVEYINIPTVLHAHSFVVLQQ